jgi:hypothetical protein
MSVKKNKDLNLAKLKYDFKIDSSGCSTTPVLEPSPARSIKAMKHYHKRSATIKLGEYVFNADVDSINYMSSILANANNTVIKMAITDDFTLESAYATVFTQTVPWKDAENIWREVPLSDISAGLELAMRNLAIIVE